MEKVLYDIHIAEAEINANSNIFYMDSARKQDLLNSVLKKHKISEAVLDTSLAWYSGNLDRYFKINNNISRRYTEAAETLRRKEEALTKKIIIPESNGFVLPVKDDRFLLRISDLSNNAYTFKPDTVINRYGGEYELQFNILGITSSINPIVTLCVQCTDTAFVKRDTISWNGFFTSIIEIPQEKQAKALYGSIYFPEVYSGMGIFIQDFTLIHSFNSHDSQSISNNRILPAIKQAK